VDHKKIHYFVYINQEKMKKLFGLLTIAFSCTLISASAQPPAGGQQMTPEERIAMMKERLKPLGLTDVQADSVVAVFTDRSYMAGMTRDTPPEERQEKMKMASEAREKRLTKSIGGELTKKVMELMTQRPGGGRGGGGK